jgi:hypothetical protein
VRVRVSTEGESGKARVRRTRAGDTVRANEDIYTFKLVNG